MRTFSLDNFEGPLELLLYLIQKDEVEICDIFLKEITLQFSNNGLNGVIDEGTTFLDLCSSLLLIKSRKLLPSQNGVETSEDDAPKWELFQQLFEYCQFKTLAEKLTFKEQEQANFYTRGLCLPPSAPKHAGIDEVELKDLKQLLQTILSKQKDLPQKIEEEKWQVSDKMTWIESLLKDQPLLFIIDLLDSNKSRIELITTFLALLELMKEQKIRLIKKEMNLLITHHASTP